MGPLSRFFFSQMFNKKASSSTIKNSNITCVICLDTNFPVSVSAQCKHPVCHDCAKSYFNSLLKKVNFNSSELIACPIHNCKQVFENTDSILHQVYTKEEVDDWWNRAIIKTFIKNKVFNLMQNVKIKFIY